jgi:energy-coupling factor transporter ATP-binding protein EcfA2
MLDNEINERIAKFENTILSHPFHDRGLARLERIYSRTFSKTQTRATQIIGEAGAGKSTLLRALQAKFPSVSDRDRDTKPIIVAVIPFNPSWLAITKAIYAAIGYQSGARDSANHILDDIKKKVEALSIGVIFLDEAQNIIRNDDEKATEFLKMIINVLPCQIGLVGTSELQSLDLHNQFDRRLEPDILLPHYSWNVPAENFHFLQILKELEKLLGLPAPSNLVRFELAARMHAASFGRIGLVSKYLRLALEIALIRQLPCIDLGLLAEVEAIRHPKEKLDEEVDYFAGVEIEEGLTRQKLLEELDKVVIDPITNPFACPLNKLNEVYKARLVLMKAEHEKRKLRIKGSGPPKVSAFA